LRCPFSAARFVGLWQGTECVGNAYTFLDMTALGRQEDWEEPMGRITPVRGGDPSFTS